ncbi:hypothetical protein FB451DRAFT_300998 [Mycena latifolia]|nr:hypothetical protein FB451DRAFT_300998 [Mycena latifolia]
MGHMCMEMSMPSMIGWLTTILYNSNNVAFEASPITAKIELIVGLQLCSMLGYPSSQPRASRSSSTPTLPGGYFASMIRLPPTPPIGKAPSRDYVPSVTLRKSTVDQFEALMNADSITIDPHKTGYIPYPAGGICYRDGRTRFLLTWSAPYIQQGENGESIGIYGIEGSKPGATAVASYLHHTVLGLHQSGHGAPSDRSPPVVASAHTERPCLTRRPTSSSCRSIRWRTKRTRTSSGCASSPSPMGRSSRTMRHSGCLHARVGLEHQRLRAQLPHQRACQRRRRGGELPQLAHLRPPFDHSLEGESDGDPLFLSSTIFTQAVYGKCVNTPHGARDRLVSGPIRPAQRRHVSLPGRRQLRAGFCYHI